MASTIDLTLSDSDFGVEELPEGNVLQRLRVDVVLLRRHGGGRRRRSLRPPSTTPPRTDPRES